jgi:hypothetical protein
VSHTPTRGPCFPYSIDRFPPMRHGMFGVFPNPSPKQMSQHLYSSQFTNPNIVSFCSSYALLLSRLEV